MQTNHTIALPIDHKAAVYVRTARAMSQSGQALMIRLSNRNSDVLISVARQYGFQPENICVYEDNGVSGTTALSEREALRALVAAIEWDEVKTVFLLSEYSLSRDASFIEQ